MEHQAYPTERKKQLLEACRITNLLPDEVTTDILFKHTVIKTLNKRNNRSPHKQRNIDMFEKLYMSDYPYTFKEIAKEYGISASRVVTITRQYLLWLRGHYNKRRK